MAEINLKVNADNKMLKNTIDADKGVMLDRIRFLEAQLPKEGEWIDIDGTMFAECSVCGKRHYGCTTPFCDMCGARMKGEQE